MPGDIRQDLGNIGAGLTMPLPLEGRLQAFTTGGEKSGLRIRSSQLGAATLDELGLVIKGVNLRGAPGLEQLDHGLRPGLEVRLAFGERVALFRANDSLAVKEICQGQRAAAKPRLREEFAPRSSCRHLSFMHQVDLPG